MNTGQSACQIRQLTTRIPEPQPRPGCKRYCVCSSYGYISLTKIKGKQDIWCIARVVVLSFDSCLRPPLYVLHIKTPGCCRFLNVLKMLTKVLLEQPKTLRETRNQIKLFAYKEKQTVSNSQSASLGSRHQIAPTGSLASLWPPSAYDPASPGGAH